MSQTTPPSGAPVENNPYAGGPAAPVADHPYAAGPGPQAAPAQDVPQQAGPQGAPQPGFPASPAAPAAPARNNLALGLVAALVAGTVSAILYGVVIGATEHEIGYAAVGVGFLVGIAAGKPRRPQPDPAGRQRRRSRSPRSTWASSSARP